jgi:tetratricopeptide (TPR) repeat protein
MASLRQAPATVPALAAIALFVLWATSQAGYPLTHWAPGALILLALLAIALLAVPLHPAAVPLAVKLALGCLAAFTALSFLSILWAAAPGQAWEGANRTLLYLIVFALFSLWRARAASAALLVCAWTLAMTALAVYVALRLDTATGASFDALFSGERLGYPADYPNATAAQWLMAFWPALLLARGERLPWALRGLLAGGAVVLADVALLSLSRGSFYSLLPMIVLVFAFVPDRLRTFATAVPVALGVFVTAPLVLRVGDRIKADQSPYAAVHAAAAATFAAALLVGLVVAFGAAFEGRRTLSPGATRRLRRSLGAIASATLLIAVVGGVVAAGHGQRGDGVGGKLITRIRHSWESFEGGYSSAPSSSSRLLSGLGSNRYDFYRVALDEFAAHPILGIGADNFQQQYLRHGRSEETPRYPHSVELRTLSQTGLLGALLAIVGLAAALVAGWRALRRTDDALAASVAAAALAGFAYWVVHGSFDWFWEFAGLGAPAFALLGVACALTPQRDASRARAGRVGVVGDGAAPRMREDRVGVVGDGAAPRMREDRVGVVAKGGAPRARVGRPFGRVLVLACAGLLALAASASLAAPWLSERQIQSAAHIWPRAPLAAYARLRDAAKLNPLSDRSYLVEGSIALRFGDLARAQRAFSLALDRVSGDAYATLELGAIASESGQRARALALLERATLLNPRDPLTRQALRTVRAGRRVSVQTLNRAILLKAEHLA